MQWIPVAGPADTISALRFGVKNMLAFTSWDGAITIVNSNSPELTFTAMAQGPVLGCDWAPTTSKLAVGGAERRVNILEIGPSQLWLREASPLDHRAAVSAVAFLTDSTIVACSMDSQVEVIDIRSPAESTHFDTPGRPVDLDACDHKVVMACEDNNALIYDMRRGMDKPLEVRHIHTSHLLRSIRCMPDGQGFAASTVASRVAIEYFHESNGSSNKSYVFRSNRKQISDDSEHAKYEAHAINTLSFHPDAITGLVGCGGSDKHAMVWNYRSQVGTANHDFPGSVVAMDWSRDGQLLAAGITDDAWRLVPGKLAEHATSQVMIGAQDLTLAST